MSTLICYEDVLPRFTRSAVREGNPHLLVNITNDSWFGDTQEPWVHLALAKFRAVEHHRALVRSTNSGVSAFVDPVGRVIEAIGVEEHELIVYCPALTVMKEASALARTPSGVRPMTETDEVGAHEISALAQRHAALWRMYVFVIPEHIEQTRGTAAEYFGKPSEHHNH